MPLRSALLAAASILVTLLVLEAAMRVIDRTTTIDFFHVMMSEHNTSESTELRLIDLIHLSSNSDLVYELNPGIRGFFQTAPVRIDRRGIRVPLEQRPPASSDALHIVGLGDSHAFGWGVDYDDTYLVGLAERFAAEHPAAPPVVVTNLGVPGYNTHQETESFATKGLPDSPDLVVLLGSRNDSGLANFIRTPQDPWRLDRSFLADFVEIRLKQLLRADRFRNRFVQKGLARTHHYFDADILEVVGEAELASIPEPLRHMAGRASVERALRRLAKLCREHAIPVMLAFYEEGQPSPLRDLFHRVAGEENVHVVDLLAPVERHLAESGADWTSLFVRPDDPHPAAPYHALIADTFYRQGVRESLERRLAKR